MRMYQGPMLTRPGGRQRTQPALGLGTHLEVVVDHRHLPVEHEVGVAGVALEQRDQRVDQLHQGQTKVLVGLVPFPVPVRVRNDGNPAGGHDRQTMTRSAVRAPVPPGRWPDRPAPRRGTDAPRGLWRRTGRPSPDASVLVDGRDPAAWSTAPPAGRSAPAPGGGPGRPRGSPGTASCGAPGRTLDSVEALLAIVRAGATLVPLNPSATAGRDRARRRRRPTRRSPIVRPSRPDGGSACGRRGPRRRSTTWPAPGADATSSRHASEPATTPSSSTPRDHGAAQGRGAHPRVGARRGPPRCTPPGAGSRRTASILTLAALPRPRPRRRASSAR